jgi:2-polyprenyl-6-methoxyphenol hydroxylase-like FAD-dependent oxidoreductase
LRELFVQLMEDSDDFYFDIIMQVKMESWTKKRIALVGDAAYCPSPLSGQGTSLALVGAYILAGELKKAAAENYSAAFQQYNTIMHPFVDANQGLGMWASESFLFPDTASKEAVSARAENVTEKIRFAANAIKLPEYL